MKLTTKLWAFLAIFFISLFVVLFISKERNYQTWENNIKISLDWYKSFKKWVDLIGWVVLTYKIDFSDYEKAYSNQQELFQVKKSVKAIIEKEVDRRINSLWVSDYSSNFKIIDGKDYIEIQIWWISDIDYAKQLIWKTVKLDFKLPFEWKADEKTIAYRQSMAEELMKQVVMSWISMELVQNPDENIFMIRESYDYGTWPAIIKDNFDKLISLKAGSYYPQLLKWDIMWQQGFAFVKFNGMDTWTNLTGRSYNFEYLFVVDHPMWEIAMDKKSNKILNWQFFLQALVEQSQTWKPWVRIDFNEEWKQIWCNVTEANVNKQLAIFVWERKVSDPVIQEKICGWSTMITFGSTSYDDATKEAKSLVEQLNYTLPVPLVLSNENKISPLLWDSALRWAIIAWVVWFIVIFLFMVFMYGIRYWIYSIAWLIIFLTIQFAIVKLMDYAFSLSGIAAILLNIWMAVDANILIYERLREELKSGKAMSSAINDGYDRSYIAIRDGNLTTWFIWVLLFMIWMNVFKWFGTMMILNIALTLLVVVPLVKEFLISFNKDK